MSGTIFDQRGQQVVYQYNAAGDINFGEVKEKADLAAELKKLQQELATAIEQNTLDDEVAIDADSEMKKAVLQAGKEKPDKDKIAGYLTKLKGITTSITALSGFTVAVVKAIAVAKAIL